MHTNFNALYFKRHEDEALENSSGLFTSSIFISQVDFTSRSAPILIQHPHQGYPHPGRFSVRPSGCLSVCLSDLCLDSNM